LLPPGFFDTITSGELTFCSLLIILTAVLVSMATPIAVSDVPKHCIKSMHFTLDPASADMVAVSDSPMAVELINGEF
jgi:hypothetical protein